MKGRTGFFILLIGFFIIMLVVGMKSMGFVGVSANKLEVDARTSQQISEDWQVVQSTTEKMGIMLFYPDDQASHVFSIYLNHQNLSFGYFFSSGGSRSEIANGIVAIQAENNGMALISMNTVHAAKIVVNNGADTQTIDLDTQQPFVYILPANTQSIDVQDEKGTSIPLVVFVGQALS